MSATTFKPSLASSVKAGPLAGLAGGLVFGAMMGMMGMLPMVGMLVKQDNAVVGFLVHLVISAFIGTVYGVVAARLPATWGVAVIAGIVNGLVWWILGALILMPLFLGMTEMIFVIGQMQWMSLIGHILYGLVTALVFLPLSQRL